MSRRWLTAALVAAAVGVTSVGVWTASTDGNDRSATNGPPTCTTASPTTVPPTTASPTTVSVPPSTTAPTSSTSSRQPQPTATTARPVVVGPAVVIRNGPASRPAVALTFDAGSDAGATARILDLLAQHGAKASFGLTGGWVEANPALARRIATEGHGVINHTQDHLSFTGLSTGSAPLGRADRLAQLRSAETAIRAATGVDPKPWFRPPYGDYDDGVLRDVASVGYSRVVMWSLDSLGWKGIAASTVAERTIAALQPGAIILLHVGAASTDVDALPAILAAAEQRSLELVTLADLLE